MRFESQIAKKNLTAIKDIQISEVQKKVWRPSQLEYGKDH